MQARPISASKAVYLHPGTEQGTRLGGSSLQATMHFSGVLGIVYSLLWLSYTQASPSATHDTSQNFTVPIWTNPNALHPRNGLHGEALMEWASREAQKTHARYSHRNRSLEARQQMVLADYGADRYVHTTHPASILAQCKSEHLAKCSMLFLIRDPLTFGLWVRTARRRRAAMRRCSATMRRPAARAT